MDLNDVLKVHIWQLPEKTDDIDKSNEYCIVEDNYTKKVSLEKLYEYFNQDYKIDNTVRYFESILQSYENEYAEEYIELEESIEYYENIISELVEKFKDNRNTIRLLETMSCEIDVYSDEITKEFSNMYTRHEILYSTLENFSSIISNLQNISNNDKVFSISKLNLSVNELINSMSQMYINSGHIKDQIKDIQEQVKTDVENKKETLLKNIDNEYDKILSIIDYYHHIHEPSIT